MTKRDYGANLFDNDPGDEPVRTEEQEFAILREAGFLPAEASDPEFGARYKAWLEKNA